jgi:hypothetical protein
LQAKVLTLKSRMVPGWRMFVKKDGASFKLAL